MTPDGPRPVDPLDVREVAPIMDRTLALMGPGGLGDLVARLPGTRAVAGTRSRLFHPGTAPAVWLGSDNLLVLGDPVVHQHVVGGVVLQRRPLSPVDLGPTVAALVAQLVREQSSLSETTTVLTAARDVLRFLDA